MHQIKNNLKLNIFGGGAKKATSKDSLTTRNKTWTNYSRSIFLFNASIGFGALNAIIGNVFDNIAIGIAHNKGNDYYHNLYKGMDNNVRLGSNAYRSNVSVY